MSRRSAGEGSIYQRSDGRWTGSLQLGGKRQSVYGKNRSEVVEKLRKLTEQAHRTGSLPLPANLLLTDYLAKWLEQAQNHLRPTTIADYEVLIRLHITPHIGHTRLARLSAPQVAAYYTTLSKRLSSRRVRMVHDLLHKTLGDAAKWGLVGANVASLVDAPKRKDKKPTLWNPEQVNEFITAILDGKGGQYGPIFTFLLASGCRIGEALGLTWSDVDYSKAIVRIERQLTELGKQLIEGAPKTKLGTRTVTLPTFGIEALKRQRAQVVAWRLRNADTWASERIFTTEQGTTPSRSNLRRSLRENCKKLGLPLIRVHDLRHISLSLLAMSGVPVKVAQQRAGHSNASITMQVYTHVLGDGDRLAADALDRIQIACTDKKQI